MTEREQQITIAYDLIKDILKTYQITLTVEEIKGVYVPVFIDEENGKKYVFIERRMKNE